MDRMTTKMVFPGETNAYKVKTKPGPPGGFCILGCMFSRFLHIKAKRYKTRERCPVGLEDSRIEMNNALKFHSMVSDTLVGMLQSLTNGV